MELNDNDLENILGGANPKAVDDKLQEGYTRTFRDKFLDSKFNTYVNKRDAQLASNGEISEQEMENVLGGANPRAVDAKLQEGYTTTFRDKVLEDKFNEMYESEERTHRR